MFFKKIKKMASMSKLVPLYSYSLQSSLLYEENTGVAPENVSATHKKKLPNDTQRT